MIPVKQTISCSCKETNIRTKEPAQILPITPASATNMVLNPE